ncbi:MAG: twin-arginine translocase TatA/TatE family subunit [Myxococcales bacterium]|nr:twin-arginine translocase TatA/TatE family subunit [Myxococcales bacterium]
MFGIGSGELVVLAIVVLIAVGPKRMPTLIKAIGKGLREFRAASQELRKQSGIDDLLRDDDLTGLKKLSREIQSPTAPPPARLTADDIRREQPFEGVDIADARARALVERERRHVAPTPGAGEDEDEDASDVRPIARQDAVDDPEAVKS